MDDKTKQAKLRSIRAAMKNLDKQLKTEGVVKILGEQETHAIESTPSGSLLLDVALGVGGWPKGRVIELYGAESSGKTLIATKAMAEVQKAGGICALIDAENAFDPEFASKLGLNPDELVVSQPETMEDSLEVMIALVESGGIDMIVLDSVAALVPRAELEAEVGKATMALQARIMSPFLRKLIGVAHRNNCTCIFINQVRDAVGVMYGDPTTTPGGKALKFYSSVRCQVSKVGGTMEKVKVGGDEITIGHMIRVKCVKNKVAPPFRKAEFMIYYDGRKVDKIDELASVALQKGLIPRYNSAGELTETGRTFKLSVEDEELIAKKRDEVAPELKKYPKIQEYLLNQIKTGVEPINYEKDETDDMTEEEFEKSLNEDNDGAEETENWNDI